MSRQKGVKTDSSKGENLFLYAAGALVLWLFFSALLGFQFMGWIGEAGRAANGWHKILAVVLFMGAIAVLVSAEKHASAKLGTFLLSFALLILAVWSAMGFAS